MEGEEESEDGNKSLSSTDTSKSSLEKFIGNCDKGEKKVSVAGPGIV